jgi:hypothetical protein
MLPLMSTFSLRNRDDHTVAEMFPKRLNNCPARRVGESFQSPADAFESATTARRVALAFAAKWGDRGTICLAELWDKKHMVFD